MNEHTPLGALGAVLDPPTDEPPDGLRHRVVSGFHGPARLRLRSPIRTGRSRLPTLGWSLAATAGLAALLVVALVTGLAGTRGRSAPGGRSTPGTLLATDILLRAAQTARADTTPPPRPDQFVYIETVNSYGWTEAKPGGSAIQHPAEPKLRRIWASADGAHDGLVRERAMPGHPPAKSLIAEALLPGCRDGRRASLDKHGRPLPGVTEPCKPSPAYRPDLPTDADGMLRYLRQGGHGTSGRDFESVAGVLSDNYLTAAQRSALFEAAARIPNVIVVPDVVDLAGRHGIAVAYVARYPDPENTSHPGSTAGPPRPVAQYQIVFDPTSYRYLGEQTVFTADLDGHKAGTVESGRAVLTTAITDRVDQLP